jgi:hypothetical protein
VFAQGPELFFLRRGFRRLQKCGLVVVEMKSAGFSFGFWCDAGDLDGSLRFGAINTKFARRGVDPTFGSATSRAVLSYFRRNLRRYFALFGQPNPFCDMLRPFGDGKLGAVKVLGYFPQASVGLSAKFNPRFDALMAQFPTRLQSVMANDENCYIRTCGTIDHHLRHDPNRYRRLKPNGGNRSFKSFYSLDRQRAETVAHHDILNVEYLANDVGGSGWRHGRACGRAGVFLGRNTSLGPGATDSALGAVV